MMQQSLLVNPFKRLPKQWGRYATLYADPPWPERGGGKIKRGADRHYALMSVKDIAALPFGAWAAHDAHLYLWVTNNYLEAGLECVKAWGFRYVTTITWVKGRSGLGQYYRGRTEHCLFAVRGHIPYRHVRETEKRAQGQTVIYEQPAMPAAFEADRQAHSVKPQQMREFIERVSWGPYLDLFARRAAPGWDVWGNEAPEGE